MPEPYLEVTVGASAAEVWRALRDPEEVRRWFGWEYEGIDAEVRLIFFGEVEADVELPPGVDSTVEVDDEARSLTTGPHRIEVVGAGPEAVVRVTRVIDVGDDGWEMFHAEIDHIEEGWRTFFQTLAFVVARHRGQPRRTVFGAGLLPGDAVAPLGLQGLPGGAGDPYRVRLATGDELTGTVWFRSPGQVGLTVDEWGDGLLVVAVVPGGTPEARAAMTVASTYGLDDDTLAALEERWSAWWAEHGLAPPEG